MPAAPLPRLVRDDGATTLEVDGAPFLMLAGELGNSSFERAYLNEYWPALETLGLNTILAPVTWELIEPVEGQYDFTSVDEILEDARAHGMRLVLLWFGSWKNSMSSYLPGWVKADTTRFPRTQTATGEKLEMLTAFSATNRDADANAFAALMRHLKQADPQHTVIMMQVENELGMIPGARDHCPEAEAAYQAWIAEQRGLRNAGHEASEAFEASEATTLALTSPKEEERFQAQAFARYVEAIVKAGKAELNLPMFTNAALIRSVSEPGQYPSAGPLPHLADIWRTEAPSLDFIAPDIYFPNFAHWADAYVASGNPLFVPEALRSPDAAVNALYAFGQHKALGFSPFGIESIGGEAGALLAQTYAIVHQLTPYLTGAYPSAGLLPPSGEMRAPHRIRVGELLLEATYEQQAAPALADGVINESGQAAGTVRLPAGALVIQTGPDEFLAAGMGVTMTFPSPAPGVKYGILNCEEGMFDAAGTWQKLRTLNGDQTHQGRHIRIEPGKITLQKVSLYKY